ncbi:AMP-binding protein [Salipiger sp. 1_MG-2023]|uniref:AMP-binding protein n=1 Tax=Salipiger sp. 1_MG-2023 TaxID=3062665 RepID=UPI0026E34301|nr:AMP-binding protein [Salipiger sp. 1_MG-2023]MDO6586727.1 AMP-binding protein [Salipiger sp. 1_MG-2023]
MTFATFHWHPESRLWRHGDACAMHLLDRLQAALAQGASLAIGPNGIDALPGAPRGLLQTRSSGTTGRAKAIRRSHGSWISSFAVNADALGITPRDSYGILGTPAQSLALYGLVEAAFLGADLHCLQGLRPARQAALMVEGSVTILYATPTQLRLLCEVGHPMPSLRHILCGGGRMPDGLRARVAQLCPGAALREFYGAAETSFIAWGDAETPEGAVGRAYPGVEIRIDAAPGGFGEIWVRSPYLFDGYAEGDSADTRWQDGFLTVGEIGRIEGGVLTVAGRRSRMVTIADTNVFPEDIEALLLGDPAVSHCAVIPRRDPRRGTQLVAVIAGNCPPALEDHLLRLCRAGVGALAAPRRVIGISDFDLTATGKPDLRALARRLEDLP